ncbi:MAG: type II toxin-antitoxin system RelE/ParE family toxin [Candidatus Peribacteraceae bacterium]
MYIVEVKKKAKKEIAALPRKEQQRVVAAFDVLRENPFAGKKLQGEHEGAWSLRVWPYRIIYTIHQKIVTVTVLRVGHRQSVYK